MRPDNYWVFRGRQLVRLFTRSSQPDYYTQMRWFTGEPMQHVMAHSDRFSTIRRLPAATSVVPWPAGKRISLPDGFEYGGEVRASKVLLKETETASLIVIKDGQIRYEEYAEPGGVDVPWLSMSVAKSFTSALVGVAVSERLIASIDDPISSYVSVNPGSAYDGVSIKNVLQMSSGARWNETYNDPEADVFKIGRAMTGAEGGFDGFIAQMSKDLPPDTVCRYNSGETQVLGALVRAVSGKSLAAYMKEKLVDPLGFEHAGYWNTDLQGVEMAYAGLNLVARDYARLGECYRNQGVFNGVQVVPAQWVALSTTVDSPVRSPGRIGPDGSTVALGYGFQWWIPSGSDGEFMAIGVLNQFVYVNPAAGVTIVKLSANRRYGTTGTEESNRTEETLEFFRAVAAGF